MDFTPRVDDRDVSDLLARLARTRWPEPETGPGQGLPREELRRLVEHWSKGYDWGRFRQRLISAPQVRIPLDGLQHHALHVRSSRSDATPLLLAHGWPSTPYEFLDATRLLTEPDDGPAFHVICPSLPGYAFSGKPSETGWGAARTADAWVELMRRLGYEKFRAHGGDWGAVVTTEIALRHPDHLEALHLTMPVVRPTSDELAEASPAEARGLAREQAYRRTGYAYAQVQRTRPQTLGYALNDSPAGLCAWLAEKLLAWSGRDDAGDSLLTDDDVLDVVSVYWLTGTSTSAARMYAESLRMDVDTPVRVPTSCSIFAEEIIRPPRGSVARRYPDLRSWREVPRGGHFPAAEVPTLFAAEIQHWARVT